MNHDGTVMAWYAGISHEEPFFLAILKRAPEEIFPGYYMNSNVISMFKFSTTYSCVTRLEIVKYLFQLHFRRKHHAR